MKIYDCFTFFNELDILELRLDVLNPYVDYFVLVECSKTQHGEDKPFYFYDNRERYEKYKDKIIYVQVNDAPEYRGETDMGIENFQRNCIMRGLVTHCRPDDYVIVSDVDEIPNPAVLTDLPDREVDLYPRNGSFKMNLRQHFRIWSRMDSPFLKHCLKHEKNTVDFILDYIPIGLEQDLFYYYMNCKCRAKWYGPYIAKYAHMPMAHDGRDLVYRRQLPIIRNAGWHFSYLGGLEAIKQKLSALSDSDPEIEKKINQAKSSDEYIQNCLANGIDILGRKGKMFEYDFVDIKETRFPDIDQVVNKYPIFYRQK